MNEKENELCIITDFAEGGDLLGIIKKCFKTQKHVSESKVWDYLEQITSGKRPKN